MQRCRLVFHLLRFDGERRLDYMRTIQRLEEATRSREFFAYYLNHLLSLKREWFREKKNVTFLSTDGLTARQVGEKVKHWCEQYI